MTILLSQAILEILKTHSSEEKKQDTWPLTQSDILKFLKEDFADLDSEQKITPKRVRNELKKMVDSELTLYDKNKTIRYATYEKSNGNDYKTGYWAPKMINDMELKFLIDSVIYSKIFDSPTAQNFARKVQKLSGKNLYNMTKYVGNSFGKQRLTIDVNVLKNVNIIQQAKNKESFINFDFNVYDMVNNKIGLRKKDNYTVKPLRIILDAGRYFLLARYENGKRVYTFSVDLMSNIVVNDAVKDDVDNKDFEQTFSRAQYSLTHPYFMGGDEKQFKLKINKDYISRLVDIFSYKIEVISRTETDKTVNVRIGASAEGMKRFLLHHYEIAEIIDASEEFKKDLSCVVKALYEKFYKKI